MTPLENTIIEALQLRGFLVAHFRPARTGDGGWSTPVAADAKGFPDIVAMRPQCPVIIIEVKDTGGLDDEQKDWRDAAQGDGRYYAVLTPNALQGILKHIEILHREYPAPPGWKRQLEARSTRISIKKTMKKIKKAATEGRALATMTTKFEIAHNTPVKFNSGATAYLYRGHALDGTVTVYGPVDWDGLRQKFIPRGKAKFRQFPATASMKEYKPRGRA